MNTYVRTYTYLLKDTTHTCDNHTIVFSQYVVEDHEEFIAHGVIEPTALRQCTGLLCQVIATICTYVHMHYVCYRYKYVHNCPKKTLQSRHNFTQTNQK